MAFVNVGNLRAAKQYKPRVETRADDSKILYRFDIQNVEWISNHFLGASTETRGGALTSVQKIKIFLRYMADPGFQSGVGEDIGIDQTTVSKIVHQVRQKIMEKAHLWIKFPETASEVQAAKDAWQGKFTMPTVIGVIDCTHIRIPKPKIDGDEYINRKGFASLNVQATCDANERFTSISAEWPGSVHDSRIFRNSSIHEVMTKCTDTILIGDSGYGIAPWMITPYGNPRNNIERNFNRIYAKERVIIERCFGQLKRRFPILAYKVRTSLPTIPSIIICCAVLHNVAKYLNDAEDFPEIEEDPAPQNENHVENEEVDSRRIRQRGQEKRDRIATLLNTRHN